MSYTDLVNRIIADGVLTVSEYEELLKTANADGKIDEEERKGILKVLEMKNNGELKFFSKN